MRKLTIFLSAITLSYGTFAWAQTQQIDPNQLEQAPFASENAIIDTAIPFAIGAREAQQSLRGSFGWPTFQEGLVHGVYFRFDPDGYARFAPTPRLDTDVFEVICRPRTYSCMGRKGSLSVLLNSRGQLQLKIDDVLSGDRFFVSEGVSEIEIPERIIQPLDTQLELLLSTGGDLIVRRGETEKDRLSLAGFMPVGAYLRWVAARQDYTILPRGWPIPNAAGPEGGVTQAASWQSPMPQPQNFPAGQNGFAQNQFQPVAQPLQVQPQQASVTSTQSEVDDVRSELKILRELLMKRNAETRAPVPQDQGQSNDTTTGSIAQLMPQTMVQPTPVSDQIEALQQASAQIQADLARLTQAGPTTTLGLENIHLTAPTDQLQTSLYVPPSTSPETNDPTIAMAKRLQYLMSNTGLDAKTALMLIQMGENKNSTSSATALPISAQIDPPPAASQDNVVAQILLELESELVTNQQSPSVQIQQNSEIPNAEYILLSQYFKSVIVER